jgi:hypothetical protein
MLCRPNSAQVSSAQQPEGGLSEVVELGCITTRDGAFNLERAFAEKRTAAPIVGHGAMNTQQSPLSEYRFKNRQLRASVDHKGVVFSTYVEVSSGYVFFDNFGGLQQCNLSFNDGSIP